MTDSPRVLSSDYMAFAKLHTGARFNLASSGVANCDLADLGPLPADLALHGDNVYGYGPLKAVIATRFGIDPACVVIPGGGCSFANHLAMAALVAPGDEVLVETPTYGLLTSTLEYLGARVVRFARPGGRLDPAAVEAALKQTTRLVVLTDLHNPTSAGADQGDVAAVARAAARVGATLMIDEVYRELTFKGGAARTAFRGDGNIVVTSSLTKAYGLSGLRCGWILAPAALAERMRRLNDLFGVEAPHLAERLAVTAFDKLESLRRRALGLTEANRSAYQEILGAHPGLDQTVFDHGTTVFPRLRAGEVERYFRVLMDQFETSVVPGRFFGAPDHFRIGLGGNPETAREGFTRVAEALAAY